MAIDLTLIPYHGQPAFDGKEFFRSEPKSGTTHFHAHATLVVVHRGYGTPPNLDKLGTTERGFAIAEACVKMPRRRMLANAYNTAHRRLDEAEAAACGPVSLSGEASLARLCEWNVSRAGS